MKTGALGRMTLVAGIHVGAIYLIAASLGMVKSIIETEPPSATIFESEPVAPETPVEVPRPRDITPPINVPPPVLDVALDAPSSDVISAVVGDEVPPPRDVIPETTGPVLQSVRPDARFPLTQPAYPARDIREGNEGSVELEVYVLPTGRIGDVRVLKSTGSPTLDQSAIDEARRRWRMLPATRDGEPYAQWHRLKVTFNLKNR